MGLSTDARFLPLLKVSLLLSLNIMILGCGWMLKSFLNMLFTVAMPISRFSTKKELKMDC